MSKLFDAELYSIKSDCDTSYPKIGLEKRNSQCPITRPLPFKITEPKKIKWYRSPQAITLYLAQILLLVSAVVIILVNWLK